MSTPAATASIMPSVYFVIEWINAAICHFSWIIQNWMIIYAIHKWMTRTIQTWMIIYKSGWLESSKMANKFKIKYVGTTSPMILQSYEVQGKNYTCYGNFIDAWHAAGTGLYCSWPKYLQQVHQHTLQEQVCIAHRQNIYSNCISIHCCR